MKRHEPSDDITSVEENCTVGAGVPSRVYTREVAQRYAYRMHTFQWHTVLEPGQRKQLFSDSTPHPVRSIECEFTPGGMVPKNASMDILMLGISHDTCRVIVDIGTACWTFSGPWFVRGAVIGKLVVPVRQIHSLFVENFGAELARVTVHELVRFRTSHQPAY